MPADTDRGDGTRRAQDQGERSRPGNLGPAAARAERSSPGRGWAAAAARGPRAGPRPDDVGERSDDPGASHELVQLAPGETIAALHLAIPSSNRRTAAASSLRAFRSLA